MRPRPERGTPEWNLWLAAVQVATAAPLKQTTNVHAAGIPWTLIDELRASLDALGIDWRTAKAQSR